MVKQAKMETKTIAVFSIWLSLMLPVSGTGLAENIDPNDDGLIHIEGLSPRFHWLN